MSIAKMTILGMETALNYRNESIFDLMNLPDGIDKDTVEDNILLEGGEFEVVYAEPDFLKMSIGVWARKHYRTFDKWIKALNIEYAPLENYDRKEEWDDTGSETSNTSKHGTITDRSDSTIHVTSNDVESEHMEGDSNRSNDTSTSTEGDTENISSTVL